METGTRETTTPEAQAAAAMAELDALADVTPPRLPPSLMAQVMGQQHVDLTRQFWARRSAGEVCTTVGDHDDAKTHFKEAKSILLRLRALKALAETRGLGPQFTELITAFETQEDAPAAQQAAVRKAINGSA